MPNFAVLQRDSEEPPSLVVVLVATPTQRDARGVTRLQPHPRHVPIVGGFDGARADVTVDALGSTAGLGVQPGQVTAVGRGLLLEAAGILAAYPGLAG